VLPSVQDHTAATLVSEAICKHNRNICNAQKILTEESAFIKLGFYVVQSARHFKSRYNFNSKSLKTEDYIKHLPVNHGSLHCRSRILYNTTQKFVTRTMCVSWQTE